VVDFVGYPHHFQKTWPKRIIGRFIMRIIELEHLETTWILIVFPPDASHFNFKPDIIQLLPSFHGLDLENSYLYLREFEEVYNTYNDSNCSMNIIRLKHFHFSLKDKAKTWLQNLKPGSIRAWDEMQQQFLKKFFPSHRTNSLIRCRQGQIRILT